MKFTLGEVAGLVDGEVAHGNPSSVEVDGADIDSRTLRAGQLFVPLTASRDGHDFIAAAAAAGAAACLVRSDRRGAAASAGLAEVVVDDTLNALWRLAAAARRRMSDRVVGITGSVGKTSTKDMLAGAIGAGRSVVYSRRSFNNHIGVPLTLLAAEGGEWAAVVEMGASDFGEIASLAGLARPLVGVVTAVGAAHTESFGDLDGVARAKSELVAALPSEGTAVLNADDPVVASFGGLTEAAVLTYGMGGGDLRGGLRADVRAELRADVRAEDIVLGDDLRPMFRLRSPWGSASMRLSAAGRHNVSNALGAAAAALSLGADLSDVVSGLSRAELSAWRMSLARTPSGALVLDDSYNANPVSMASALRALADLPARRRVAVLGVMAELGKSHDAEHEAAAALAAELGIEVLAVDEPAYGVGTVGGIDGALRELGALGDGDAVLVKGSRVAGLERLAAALRGAVDATTLSRASGGASGGSETGGGCGGSGGVGGGSGGSGVSGVSGGSGGVSGGVSGVQQVNDVPVGGLPLPTTPFRHSLNVWGGVREIFC